MKEIINSDDGDLRIYFIAIKHWCVCDNCKSCSGRITHDKYQAIKIGKTTQRLLKKRLGDMETYTIALCSSQGYDGMGNNELDY